MASPVLTIIRAAIADGSDMPSKAKAMGNAILAAVESGLVTVTPDQKTLAQVMVGDRGADALVPVVTRERATLVQLIDRSMNEHVPAIKDKGHTYRWDDAKASAGSLVWYIAAASMAAPAATAAGIAPALSFGLALDESPIAYGQDPITIILVIGAIVGIAVGIVTLVSQGIALYKSIFPPKPATAPVPVTTTTTGPTSTPTTTPTTASTEDDGPSATMLIVGGLLLWWLVKKPDEDEAKAA